MHLLKNNALKIKTTPEDNYKLDSKKYNSDYDIASKLYPKEITLKINLLKTVS